MYMYKLFTHVESLSLHYKYMYIYVCIISFLMLLHPKRLIVVSFKLESEHIILWINISYKHY